MSIGDVHPWWQFWRDAFKPVPDLFDLHIQLLKEQVEELGRNVARLKAAMEKSCPCGGSCSCHDSKQS